jgi:hypothetical protein
MCNFSKTLLVGLSLSILTACTTPHISQRNTLNAEDQCKILNKKRSAPGKSGKIQLSALSSRPRFSPSYPPAEIFLPADGEFAEADGEHPQIHFPPSEAPIVAVLSTAQRPEAPLAQAKETGSKKSSTGERPASLPRKILKNGRFVLGVILLGLGMGLALMLRPKPFKATSHWAKQKPVPARWAVTGIHVASWLGALGLGQYLWQQGVWMDDSLQPYVLVGTSLAAASYPMRKNAFGGYVRRKMHDLALFIGGVALLLMAGNHYTPMPVGDRMEGEVVVAMETTLGITPLLAKNKIDKVKPAKTEPKKYSAGTQAALIFLTILAFLGLTYLLLGLSCSLACSGNEGLAYIVFFGGMIGLVALLVTVIRSITGKSRKKKLDPEVPAPTPEGL